MNIDSPKNLSGEQPAFPGQVNWGQMLKGIIILFALPAVILFVSSGQLQWEMAWFYVGLVSAFSLGSRIIMLRKSPELIAERAQALDKEDSEAWDKVLMPLGIIIFIVALIVAGLDKRFEWSPNLPLLIHAIAFVITALGFSLSTWATVENKYFSSVVRIQNDREHSVVASGPYRFIRHPGYAGTIVTSLATPLLLGSLWALIPAGLAVCQLITRASLEDRTLQGKLEGYQDYTAQVRYRLLPGVW